MRKIKKHKQIIILIMANLVMCALVAGILHILIAVSMYNDSRFEVSGLHIKQDGFTLNVEWDEVAGSTGYRVLLFSGFGMPYSFEQKENECTIKNIVIGEEYKLIVAAIDENGHASGGFRKIFKTRKIPQKIYVSEPEYEGFAKDEFTVKAKAHGKLIFSSSKPEVMDVDETGSVTLKKTGVATVIIDTEGTKNYRAARRRVHVTVYPDELSRVELKIKKKSDTLVTLEWTPVEMAEKYILLKYNPAKDRYEEFEIFGAKETDVELLRNQAKYKIKAQAKVNGQEVFSKPSESLTVDAKAKNAKAYSSSHNIATLNDSNLDVLAVITGSGSIKVPQSMSFNGKEYIISYVNQSGSEGAFLVYDKQGNYVRGNRVGGMGFANGSTYDPNKGKIYVVKTHKGYKTNSCSRYKESDLSSDGTFNLPRVTSGIAYDESNNKYYLSKGNEIYVTDDNFNVEKFIHKKIRYNHAQDICAYNGVVMVCTWVNGSTSYIDLYRASDGAYLGSFYVPMGEIESVVVDDGYLVILMNKIGTSRDYIYKTKERISIP